MIENISLNEPGPQTRRLGVYNDNRRRPIHRWYPFVEGYSSELVTETLSGLKLDQRILDPFGGSGTTALAAAELGYDTSYCEVNPYLAWVADVKVNVVQNATAREDLIKLIDFAGMLERGFEPIGSMSHPLVVADQCRGFFPSNVALTVVGLLEHIDAILEGPIAMLAQLAVSTSLIPASNMVRRTDLRKRRAGDPIPLNLLNTVSSQLRMIYFDTMTAGSNLSGVAKQVAADVRELSEQTEKFNLIVTSPPYLNGTNYCRNTKLELLALNLLDAVDGLSKLRVDSITAGINNVSRRRAEAELIPEVEIIATQLDEVAYDHRIPSLVRLYFADMRIALRKIRKQSVTGARFLLDIGDSKFAGVHVPTPDLLVTVAENEGWHLDDRKTLRSRRSYDGSKLTQVLLEMRAE
jgi:hypothetical protein